MKRKRASETLIFILIASFFVAAPWALALKTESNRYNLPVPDYMQAASEGMAVAGR